VTTEETNRVRISERKDVRKIYGPTLGHKNKTGEREKEHIRNRMFCKMYQIPPRWYGNVKVTQDQNPIALAPMERNNKNRTTMQNTERRGRRRLKDKGNKKRAGSGQRPSGIEEDCIGSQATLQTVELESKMKMDEDFKSKYGPGRKGF
jgi:hypothetical protein